MSDVTVASRWHEETLVWVFSLGALTHGISDADLKKWLHSPHSGQAIHNMPHDGCIRKRHTAAYIERVVLQ